jgi:hypothetical protein
MYSIQTVPNSKYHRKCGWENMYHMYPCARVRCHDQNFTLIVQQSKLTETELAERIASIRLKNETLTLQHAAAEADAASFHARESAAKERDAQRLQANEEARRKRAEQRKVETANQKAMNSEREKYRLRKLEAQGNREWDGEKGVGFMGTGEERRRGARRGAFGGVVGGNEFARDTAQHIPDPTEQWVQQQADLQQMEHQEAVRGRGRGSFEGRGRGRGGRGGRGRGGGHHHEANGSGGNQGEKKVQQPQQQQRAPTASDFPELPPASAPKDRPSTNAPVPVILPGKSKKDKDTLPQTTQDVPSKSAEQDQDGPPSKPAGKDAQQDMEGKADDKKPQLKKLDSFGMPMSPAENKRSWADQVEGAGF